VIYRFSDCELDTELFELRRRGARRQVEPQVFDVLAYLIAHRDRVVTREELVAQVWGHSYLSDATLNSRLMAARKAIGDDGRTQELIRTLRGRGYRFVARVEQGLQRVADGVPGTPLVGRVAERAVLGRLLDEAAGGQRRLALVTGEAGIGKTTLVDAFAAEAVARKQLLVANGRCVEQPAGAEPYMPVLEALGTLARTNAGPAVVETLSTFAPSWLPQLPGVAGEAVLEAARDRAQGAGPERMLRELHRLHAAALLDMSGSEAAQEARAALRTGLELARRQGARSLELRLAVSLAQVLGERDGSGDALDLLSGTLGWFPRDADSADLREARALEAHLARRPA
jgi:DNA-binding winged helix-turn-helix (wHTH) protein